MATAATSGRLTRTWRDRRAGLRGAWAVARAQALARPAWLTLAAITLLAAALRLIPWLAVYPLHHDEALYGAWGRLIASGRDPFLLTPWVDKPPLSLYLIAASFRLFGVSELALRLPGMLAGLLTVWAAYGLARRASGHRAALLAAMLLALSPFAVLFAPTAFTDPWLTLWLVTAAWAALSGRPLLAGLTAGLAVASKQQGVFVVPLVLALLTAGKTASYGGHGVMADHKATWTRACAQPPFRVRRFAPLRDQPAEASSPGRRRGIFGLAPMSQAIQAEMKIGQSAFIRARPRPVFGLVDRGLHAIALAALGFALIFGPLTWWDSLRWHNRPSFWERSLDTYGGLSLAAPAAWPGRAVEWTEPLGYLFGTPALSALILALAVVSSVTGPRPTRVLGLYTAGYLLLHLAVTFQPWDRYLLPILPLVCVLAAQGGMTAARWLHNQVSAGTRMNTDERGKTEESARVCARPRPMMVVLSSLAIALAVIVAHAAWLGAAGRIPVGSDYGAYRGVDRAAAALAALPSDAVIYYHAIGWHLDFYLFDAPQERRWYGTAEKLARDAGATARAEPVKPQWLVLPAWEAPDVAALQVALAGEDLRLEARAQIARADGQPAFTLYRMASLVAQGEP